MSQNGLLHRQVASRGFYYAHMSLRPTKTWPALVCLAGRETFNLQAVLLSAAQNTAHYDASRWSDLQQAHLVQELLAAVRFEFSPQVIRPQQQRHVIGVLEIC